MNDRNTTRGTSSHQNGFVGQLIRLQQDGKEAISGPDNWLNSPPLLEVDTESRESLGRLLDELCPDRGTSDRGRWHWLIGSPGNGKSAKMGVLARLLIERGYELSNNGEPLDQAESGFPPYLLEVRQRGKPYPFAYLVQDASVVSDPFGQACDPARDLESVLSKAASRGISLLLCANWGVVQRLFDRGHTGSMRNEEWFRAVRHAVRPTPGPTTLYSAESRKTVFDQVRVTYEVLDNRSLLVGSDVFRKLVAKATEEKNWVACEGCPSLPLCPFKANRDDLVCDEVLDHTLDVLRRGEVLDGQVLVFREAVALVSLFLAGCPNDHAQRSPCDWVHELVAQEDLFALFARRLPALLFGTFRCHGLEPVDDGGPPQGSPQRRQLSAIRQVADLLRDSRKAQRAIRLVTTSAPLSADVGVSRLLGRDGVLRRLDPSLDPRNVERLDGFIAELTKIGQEDSPGIRGLERRCMEYWDSALDAIERNAVPTAGLELYYWTKRWQSTRLAWLAAVTTGATAFGPELDEYTAFLSSPGSLEEVLKKMKGFERELESLLATAYESRGPTEVELAATLWLGGDWVAREFRPRLKSDRVKASNALEVKLGRRHTLILNAESFLWLNLRRKLGLSDLSFDPNLLEALRRVHAQAAAASGYSRKDDDVSVTVLGESGERFRFERTQGYLLPPERL